MRIDVVFTTQVMSNFNFHVHEPADWQRTCKLSVARAEKYCGTQARAELLLYAGYRCGIPRQTLLWFESIFELRNFLWAKKWLLNLDPAPPVNLSSYIMPTK